MVNSWNVTRADVGPGAPHRRIGLLVAPSLKPHGRAVERLGYRRACGGGMPPRVTVKVKLPSPMSPIVKPKAAPRGNPDSRRELGAVRPFTFVLDHDLDHPAIIVQHHERDRTQQGQTPGSDRP
jgi:hypothetical protein